MTFFFYTLVLNNDVNQTSTVLAARIEGTVYEVKMLASNKYGTSGFSPLTVVNTRTFGW